MLETTVQHQDVLEARQCAGKCQTEGSRAKLGLSKRSRLTAGDHVEAGTNSVGKHACELMAEGRVEKERRQQENAGTFRRYQDFF